MGLGQWGDNHHNLVNVGRYRFQLAIGVRPGQHAVALLLGDNNAHGVAVAPNHLVTGDQPFEIGAHMAAAALAWGRFHFNLRAEMGSYQAVALGAEFAGGQELFRLGTALVGTLGAFLLDFFDAPGLLAGKLAFRHFGIIGVARSSVEAICYTAF